MKRESVFWHSAALASSPGECRSAFMELEKTMAYRKRHGDQERHGDGVSKGASVLKKDARTCAETGTSVTHQCFRSGLITQLRGIVRREKNVEINLATFTCRARHLGKGKIDVRLISARSSGRNRLALEQRNHTEAQGSELSPFAQGPPATKPQIQVIGQGTQIALWPQTKRTQGARVELVALGAGGARGFGSVGVDSRGGDVAMI
jgi:hypothetical protein